VSLTVRHGQIQDAKISGLKYGESLDGLSQDQAISKALVGRTLDEIRDWHKALEEASPVSLESEHVGKWLNGLFGVGRT
jgi:lipoate-protein ligase A